MKTLGEALSMNVTPNTSFVLNEDSDTEPHLFVDCWDGANATDNTRNVLLILHGLGEHGGRYQHFPRYLGKYFHRFYAMDQRGHGRSGGLRGYAPSFSSFTLDLKNVVLEIQKRESGARLYFFAHSFGGLVGLKALLENSKLGFEKAIISAPLLGVKLKVPGYKKFLGEALGRVLPRVQMSNEVNPSHLSHDPEVVERYVNDRLVHHKITPKLYLEMMEAMKQVLSNEGPLACPTLILVAGQDKIVDSEVTLEFYRNLKDRNKKLKQYPEMYHEIVNEIGKEKVFEDIKEWIH